MLTGMLPVASILFSVEYVPYCNNEYSFLQRMKITRRKYIFPHIHSTFPFSFYKKTFPYTIIAAVSFTRHGLDYPMFFQFLSKIHMLVLPALIRMENEPFHIGNFRNARFNIR